MLAIAFIQRAVAGFGSLRFDDVLAEFDLAQFEDGGACSLRKRQARAEAIGEAETVRTARQRDDHRDADVGGDIQQPGFPIGFSLS